MNVQNVHNKDVLRFKPKKGHTLTIVLSLSILVCLAPCFSPLWGEELEPWGLAFSLVTALLLLALMLDIHLRTYYLIRSNELFVRSSIFKFNIPLESIRKIERSRSGFAGYRLALSTRGVNVYYNKYDEVFISPEDLETFCEEIVKRNPKVDLKL